MRRTFVASLATLILTVLVPALSPAATAWIPMTSQNTDWNDYLEVDNTGANAATFTLTLYDDLGNQVYNGIHSAGAYAYTTILIKGLVSTAFCGKVTYADPDLFFRMAYESVAAGGVAEFLLSDRTASTALLLFSNFSASTVWKGGAVMNTGSAPATITVYGFAGGSFLGRDTHTLAPRGMKALTPEQWLPSLDASTAGAAERLVMVSDQPLSALTISGDATTSRLLFAPGAGLSTFTPPSESLTGLLGDWVGTWASELDGSGELVLHINTDSPTTVAGTMDITDAECGDFTNLAFNGTKSGGVAALTATYICFGAPGTLTFTLSSKQGTTLSGQFTEFLEGNYDLGTWSVNRDWAVPGP